MNDPSVVLALHSLLVHSILAWVIYYNNDHPTAGLKYLGPKWKQLYDITM